MAESEKIRWKTLTISTNNIEISTAKAVLIKMPHKSAYDGFMFWHPAKLVREGDYLYSRKISYTDDFEFRLFKKGKGRFNYNQKIAEKAISASEMRKAMKMMEITMLDPYELHTPELIEPVEVEVLEELKDE